LNPLGLFSRTSIPFVWRILSAFLRATRLNPLAERTCFSQALFYRSTLSAVLEAAGGAVRLAVTADNWQAEPLHELIGHFAESQIRLAEKRRLFAGFLVHPAFCRPWHARLAAEAAQEEAAATATASLATTGGGNGGNGRVAVAAATASSTPGGGGRFSVRRHAVTEVAQAIVLAKDAAAAAAAAAVLPSVVPGRGGSGGGGGGLEELVVPLDHLLRTFCRLGRNDREIPIGMVYAQLNRLRALLRDAHTLNQAADAEIEADDGLAFRLQRLLDQLNSLGFALPGHGRVPLRFEALAELVAAVEAEHAELIAGGRDAAQTGGPVEYMALQELFPVGAVVVTAALGGLSHGPLSH
jgi:hypothetical protein